MVPQQSINAANAVKVAMDETKKLVDTLEGQIKTLKYIVKDQKSENDSLVSALVNRGQKNVNLQKENHFLMADNKSLKKKANRVGSVAVVLGVAVIIETFLLYVLIR